MLVSAMIGTFKSWVNVATKSSLKDSSSFWSVIFLKITILKIAKGKTVNAKSIMGIMSLGLGQGDELTVIATGEDEEAAGRFQGCLRHLRPAYHHRLPHREREASLLDRILSRHVALHTQP